MAFLDKASQHDVRWNQQIKGLLSPSFNICPMQQLYDAIDCANDNFHLFKYEDYLKIHYTVNSIWILNCTFILMETIADGRSK